MASDSQEEPHPSPANLPAPDDSGTDSLLRYRYQAHVAFQYCLNCVQGGRVQSVICEHFEDLAIELDDRWRLTQVKTRDLGRGPWTLTDLLASS